MRIDYVTALPAAQTALMGLEKVVHNSDLDPRLVELVKVRASQINGCARCLEMHTDGARKLGEDQHRLDLIGVWSEAGCFTEQERAALGWCESLTLIADTGAPDDVYDAMAKYFDPGQIVALTLAVSAINIWNRMSIALRIPPDCERGS